MTTFEAPPPSEIDTECTTVREHSPSLSSLPDTLTWNNVASPEQGPFSQPRPWNNVSSPEQGPFSQPRPWNNVSSPGEGPSSHSPSSLRPYTVPWDNVSSPGEGPSSYQEKRNAEERREGKKPAHGNTQSLSASLMPALPTPTDPSPTWWRAQGKLRDVQAHVFDVDVKIELERPNNQASFLCIIRLPGYEPGDIQISIPPASITSIKIGTSSQWQRITFELSTPPIFIAPNQLSKRTRGRRTITSNLLFELRHTINTTLSDVKAAEFLVIDIPADTLPAEYLDYLRVKASSDLMQDSWTSTSAVAALKPLFMGAGGSWVDVPPTQDPPSYSTSRIRGGEVNEPAAKRLCPSGVGGGHGRDTAGLGSEGSSQRPSGDGGDHGKDTAGLGSKGSGEVDVRVHGLGGRVLVQVQGPNASVRIEMGEVMEKTPPNWGAKEAAK